MCRGAKSRRLSAVGRKDRWTLAGLAAAALLARPALAAQDCPAIDRVPTFAESCPAADPVGPVGLRVFLDRRTGRIRAPTPEEARALFETRGRGIESLEPLEVVVHPDGMRSVDLKGAFEQQVVLRRNPDGSIMIRCQPAAEQK
jgi:hypothetical protein